EPGVSFSDGAENFKSRDHSVAGQADFGEDDVPRLFAAQAAAALEQFVQHILIADGDAGQLNASFSQSQFQSEIAHYCRNDSVASKLPARGQVIRHDEHHLVAVHQIAALIDHQ